jgi:hypothetical protein
LRLDPFTIFLDENHQDNPHILKVLSENMRSDEKVIRHRDAGFTAGELDENWLPTAGRSGWIVISTDTRLWRRSVLREVLFRSGVRAFIFTENNLRGETRAQILAKALPKMREMVRDNPPPFVASLTTEGNVHVQFDDALHKRVLKREQRSHRRAMKKKAKLRTARRKEKGSKMKRKTEKLKIPLNFKQTVMAALETPPEPRKKPTKKKPAK